MKLNLFSQIEKKILILYLLTSLSSQRANAGQAFNKCISYFDGAFVSYDALLAFPFTNNDDINRGKALSICCNKVECTPRLICFGNENVFYCYKLSQSFGSPDLIFCTDLSHCGGIVGDTLINGNITTAGGAGGCKDIYSVASYLATITPLNINDGFPNWPCLANSPCATLSCSWDNNGWMCFSTDGSGGIKCFLRWNSSFPKDNSLISSSPITYSSSFSSNSFASLPTANLPNNSFNAPNSAKIIISIGVTVAVISISGITYYLIYKKRKRQNLEKNNHKSADLQIENSFEEQIQTKKVEKKNY